jgi:hypothetical protein
VRRWGIILARFGLLGAAIMLLYFGAVFLLLVPGFPGEPYLVKERWLYGVLPLAAGVLTMGTSTWLALAIPGSRTDFVGELKRSFRYAGIGATVVFLVLYAIDSFREHPKQVPAFTKTKIGAVPLRADFLNPSRSYVAVEVRLGVGSCDDDPVVHVQKVNGDAGWVLAISALPQEKLCWRTARLRNDKEGTWGQWQVLTRTGASKPETETYEVTLQ